MCSYHKNNTNADFPAMAKLSSKAVGKVHLIMKAASRAANLSLGYRWEHLIQKEPGRFALSQVMMMKRDDINIC